MINEPLPYSRPRPFFVLRSLRFQAEVTAKLLFEVFVGAALADPAVRLSTDEHDMGREVHLIRVTLLGLLEYMGCDRNHQQKWKMERVRRREGGTHTHTHKQRERERDK